VIGKLSLMVEWMYLQVPRRDAPFSEAGGAVYHAASHAPRRNAILPHLDWVRRRES
jgi:hypothetical protein